MVHAVKHTVIGLLKNIFSWYSDAAIQLAKIRAVSAYVKAVGIARIAFLGAVALKCVLGLMFAGFLLAHIALLILIPLPMNVKAIALLVLGCLYFLIGIITVCVLSSQHLWMKYSGASQMVSKVVSEN